jgi:hypothetical protein
LTAGRAIAFHGDAGSILAPRRAGGPAPDGPAILLISLGFSRFSGGKASGERPQSLIIDGFAKVE